MRQKVQPRRKAPPSTHALHLLLVREGVKVISQAEASRSRPDSASEAPVGKEWWNVSCFLHDTWAPSGIHDPTETGRRRDASSAWAHPGSTPEMQWHSSSPGIEAAARARLVTQWNIEFPQCFQTWWCQIGGATRLTLQLTDKLKMHPRHKQAHNSQHVQDCSAIIME